MDNSTIADQFSLLAKLMDIHGENSFKTKTYSVAAFNIDKLPVQLADVEREKIFSLKGIGQSVGNKVLELLDSGSMELLNEYLATTPPGILEMLHIKGIGPKKIHTIWKELHIETIGELLYACNENRLTLYKGFGAKTQQNIADSIQFYQQHQGHFLFAEMDALMPQILPYLTKLFAPAAVAVTGAFRRQLPVIHELAFVIGTDAPTIHQKLQTAQPPELIEEQPDSRLYQLKNGVKLRFYPAAENFAQKLFETSAADTFLEVFKTEYPQALKTVPAKETSDEAILKAAGLPWIPPCLRESPVYLSKDSSKTLPALIQPEDVRGIIHSHSNWSDGSSSIEEMIKGCQARGLEYLVISDHSVSAFYANGLDANRVLEQHKYIDELNQRYAPFRVFKSIESDILNDGSLDYPEEILARFDLVIGSIHSNLKMPLEKAMERLIRAIENPFMRILGHMTGRLLLSRPGYPVEHEKIIEACAQHNVVIELNAHPRRLDIDWEWLPLAIEKKVLISIDPDAHAIEGFDDTKYGVLAAQKGGLTKEQNLSSMALAEFEMWLEAGRKG